MDEARSYFSLLNLHDRRFHPGNSVQGCRHYYAEQHWAFSLCKKKRNRK